MLIMIKVNSLNCPTKKTAATGGFTDKLYLTFKNPNNSKKDKGGNIPYSVHGAAITSTPKHWKLDVSSITE